MTITYDAKLADKIIVFYADLDQLTEEECSAQLPRISEDNRGPLCDLMSVLNDDGIIDPEESKYLEGGGFPRDFIRLLAGQDGTRPLNARIAAVTPRVPGLIDNLKKGDELTRARTASELAWMGPLAKNAVPALTSTLNDKSESVRANSAEALGLIGSDAKSSAQRLCDLTRDAERSVRYHAIKALGEIGEASDAVKAALRFWLDDKDDFLRDAAKDALKKLNSQSNCTCTNSKDVFNP